MDKENIKKIISKTLSSEEFMNGIIEQIQSQIKEEQEKVNEKAKVTKIKKSTNQYISETKKIQDMMKNVKNNTKNDLNKNQINSKSNSNPLYFNLQRINDTICDIYTNFPENILDINYSDMGNNIKRLNSFLDSNVESLNNWYFDELCDRDIPNRCISENLSAYFYQFFENESIGSTITSYIYIDFDDISNRMTIYIINYNNFNYKIYDFYKWIFEPNDNASDEEMILFYFNLYNYFLDVNIQFPSDDCITERIRKYIITYQNKTIYSTKNTIIENLKDIILSITKSHVDDDLEDDLDISKEYSKQASENINISSSDNTLNVEINSSKDKIDKIKLLLHLAMDGFIEVKYNNGKILLDIDGNFVFMDNPYWK